MAVQASFGSCCFFAAAAMAVDASAEAMDAVTDATVSGSSYSFCAAVVMITASDASDQLIGLPTYRICHWQVLTDAWQYKKGRISCLFCYDRFRFS